VARTTQSRQQAIGTEFNISAHQLGIHANKFHRKGVLDKLLFDFDSVANNLRDTLNGELVEKFAVEEAGKVTVESFVSGDELVGKAKARHETTLLEPKDGTE